MATSSKNESKMPFVDHLEELRWRLIKIIIAVFILMMVCFFFSKQLFALLIIPFQTYNPGDNLIYLAPIEGFMVQLKISLVAGIILGLPVIIYQIWTFVAPGLYPKEKKPVPLVILVTILSFSAGAVFAYSLVIPFSLRFLASFQIEEQLVQNLAVSLYMEFVLMIIIVFGIVFELPLISALLARIGLVTAKLLRKIRSYAITVIFILAAILTPPDFLTQILLGIPLLILYEISIWVARIFEKRRAEAAADDEDDDEEDELDKYAKNDDSPAG